MNRRQFLRANTALAATVCLGGVVRPTLAASFYHIRPLVEIDSPVPARAARLKPRPLKELSRDQNQALARGLAFSRRERTPGVKRFLRELAGKRSRINRPIWLAAGVVAVAAVGLLVVVSLWPEPPAPEPQAIEPEPVVLDPEIQARVNSILQVADAHFSIDRLVEPPGSNAAEAYRAVLELHAGNPEAVAGLDKVASRIVTLARDHMVRGSIDDAGTLVPPGRYAIRVMCEDPTYIRDAFAFRWIDVV